VDKQTWQSWGNISTEIPHDFDPSFFLSSLDTFVLGTELITFRLTCNRYKEINHDTNETKPFRAYSTFFTRRLPIPEPTILSYCLFRDSSGHVSLIDEILL